MLCSTECTRVAEPCSPFAISLCSGLWLRLRLLVYCKSSIYNLFLQFVCLKKVLAILFSLDMKNILKKIIFLKNFAKFKAFLFYLCFIFWVEPDLQCRFKIPGPAPVKKAGFALLLSIYTVLNIFC